jgi:hypothetical protein
MNLVWYPFLLLAATGFACSVVVHVLSWLGVAVPQPLMLLHLGIFIVWLPTIIASTRLARNHPQRDFWKASLRGAPLWASKSLIWLGGYVLVHFFASILLLQGRLGVSKAVEDFRIVSGHWMIFYGVATGVLYSAIHAVDEERKCPQGHPVSSSAHFCEVCGAPVSPHQG